MVGVWSSGLVCRVLAQDHTSNFTWKNKCKIYLKIMLNSLHIGPDPWYDWGGPAKVGGPHWGLVSLSFVLFLISNNQYGSPERDLNLDPSSNIQKVFQCRTPKVKRKTL